MENLYRNDMTVENQPAETTTSVSDSSNLADIPENEISKWREYFPGLSDEELKKKYNQTL